MNVNKTEIGFSIRIRCSLCILAKKMSLTLASRCGTLTFIPWMALKPTKSYELIWLQGTFGDVWSTYFCAPIYWNHFDFVYPLIEAFRLKLLASIRRTYDCVVEVVFHHLFGWACDAQFQFGVWMNLNVSYNCFAPNRIHFQKQTKLRGPVIQIVRKSVLIIDISTETKII